MTSVALYLLRQPDSKAICTLVLSILILPLSAFSFPFVPHFIWVTIRSSYVFSALYIVGVCFLTRWFAQGGQYDGLTGKNLSGKTYLITGSSGGVGKQTALELVKRGAKVVLFARPEHLQQSIDEVRKVAREAKLVSGYPIDLADLISIEKCIEQYKANEGTDASITALINDAGVMGRGRPYTQTKDGFEMHMGINHFGHFYLTQLLLPQLLKSKSRVVNVSSRSHAFWQVACTPATYAEELNKGTYNAGRAYALSKIANIYFTIELQRRFGAQGLQAYAVHPGAVDTDISRNTSFNEWFMIPFHLLLLKTKLEGAQTTLFCAISDEAVPGKYHADCQQHEVAHPQADNPERAREWWDYSEKIVAEKVKERRH